MDENNTNPLPSILDREIDTVQADAFGHRDLADALESLIEDPAHKPPFSIGLLGGWGSGKSSVKSLYLSALKDDRSRAKLFHPITFNAWRFGGENIKRALLRHVYLTLGGDNECLTDALYRKIQQTVQSRRSWREIFRDLYDKWVWGLCQILLLIGGFLLTLLAIQKIVPIENDFAAFGVVGVLAFLANQVMKHLFSLERLIVPRYSRVVRVDEPRASAEEYEDMLVEQLAKFKAAKGRSCDRLVVFVDDLDRLSAEEMISGLDAVRTFLEIPTEVMPGGLGIVFVISCDEGRVAEALARRSKSRRDADVPATVSDESSARRYLDRIFQFRLDVPDVPKLDMRRFAADRLQTDLKEVVKDLDKAGVPVDTFIDRLIHVGVHNPRNAIQILNAFTQSWWLAKKREREGAGTERPGGLQENAVTGHPLALAAVCVLRVDFPDFYGDLLTHPELIQHFLDAFHRKHAFEELSEAAQVLLWKYRAKKAENGQDGENCDVRPEHRALRRYLASLEGLKWPPSIQPLLLLAQDPITRRLGDHAVPIYAAFVSGDHNELLRLFNRDKDSRPLANEDAKLLVSMMEDCDRESTVLKDNAAACIAALTDRLPESHLRPLITPLARRIAASQELRWRLGIDKIGQVLQNSAKDDQQDIAHCLISDLLRTTGDVDFTLETGQSPSLDEAAEMARKACNLILEVRRNCGLSEAHDARLLEWLLSRRVGTQEQEYVFPFAQLEKWMDAHEEHLLLPLKQHYTEIVISGLEEEELEEPNTERPLGRCERVFGTLWDEGEESRQTLWQQLLRLVTVCDSEAVKLAWEQMHAHANAPDETTYSHFVVKLTQRLRQGVEGDADWGVDWISGVNILVGLLSRRSQEIQTDAASAVTDLTLVLGGFEEGAELACKLGGELQKIDKTALTKVVSDWIQRMLSDLPEPCVEWLALRFPSALQETEKTQFVNQLNTAINKPSVGTDEAARYLKILRALSKQALSSEPIQAHLNNLCAHIQSHPDNPSHYLERVFPAIPLVSEHCPPKAFGSMLHTIFTGTKTNPELFGRLHGHMTGHWPQPDPALAPYNPESLLNEGVQVARSNPDAETIADVLLSLASMLRDAVVAQEHADVVADVACVLWHNWPDEAYEVLVDLDVPPEPKEVAGLSIGIEVTNSDYRERLRKIWSELARRMNNTERLETTCLLLGKQMQAAEDHPDFLMYLWLDVCVWDRQLLSDLVSRDSLNDDQSARVWAQIMNRTGILKREFWLDALPVGLSASDKKKTVQMILNARDDVTQHFVSKEERYELAKVLLNSLLQSTSQEDRNLLGAWIKNLDAAAVLKEISDTSSLPEGVLEILKGTFPKSRYLKK